MDLKRERRQRVTTQSTASWNGKVIIITVTITTITIIIVINDY